MLHEEKMHFTPRSKIAAKRIHDGKVQGPNKGEGAGPHSQRVRKVRIGSLRLNQKQVKQENWKILNWQQTKPKRKVDRAVTGANGNGPTGAILGTRGKRINWLA